MAQGPGLTTMVLAGLIGCEGAEPAVGPNVLLILLDDIGVDGIAAYGESPDPPQTPTLDRLTLEGVRFTRAYAYSVCAPSRAALLTGRYGRRTTIGHNPSFNGGQDLPLSEVTLAEVARDAGYRTAAFGKWHLASRSPRVADAPNRQGFEHFAGMVQNFDKTVEQYDEPTDYFVWERNTDGDLDLARGYAPTLMIDEALAWIDNTPEPWFVYLPLPTAHGPMHVPAADLQGTGVTDEDSEPAKFRAVVEAGDTELGRLLDSIPDAVLADTLVIMAGDNGTDSRRDAVGFDVLGGKVSVYEGGIRVPLVVWGAGVPGAGVHGGLVHLIDVFPTVAEWIGAEPDGVLDGQSLWPWILEPAAPPGREVLYDELFGPPGAEVFDNDRRIAVSGDRKLVQVIHDGTELFAAVGDSPTDEVLLDPDALTAEDEAARDDLRAAIAGYMDGFE